MPLPLQLVTQLRAVASSVETAADAAERAASSSVFAAVASWVGADSTASAGKSLAHSQRVLATSVRARVERIIASADQAGAEALVRDAEAGKWADTSTLTEARRLVSVSGFTREVVSKTAADVGSVALDVGKQAASAAQGVGGVVLFLLRNLWLVALVGGAFILWRSSSSARALLRGP